MREVETLQGKRIEILEMILKNMDDQLEVTCKIHFEHSVFLITFFNVSRFRIGEVSAPIEIHGFEIIDHSKDGWGQDSTYEIHDFEDDYVRFFCEYFTIEVNTSNDI